MWMGLTTPPGSRLGKNLMHVILHGGDLDAERSCDLLIREPLLDQIQHVQFSRRQEPLTAKFGLLRMRDFAKEYMARDEVIMWPPHASSEQCRG
jgi:hypothetical protein